MKVLADAAHRRVRSSTPVNLAFGGRISIRDLIAVIESELGEPVRIDNRPPRPGDVPHSQADASAMTALFPDIDEVPLEKGLADTIAWFREGADSLA